MTSFPIAVSHLVHASRRAFDLPNVRSLKGTLQVPWLAGLLLLLGLAPASLFAQSPITFSPTTLPPAVVGTGVYTQTITASGGTGSKTFEFVSGSGSLPAGFTLSPAGVLSGTPTTGGQFTFLVRATDQTNVQALWSYTLNVFGPPTAANPVATNVAAGSATLGGELTNTGGLTVPTRGIVYSVTSANPNPVLGGPGVTNLSISGSAATGPFTVNATGLTQGTTYSFKAYATNSTGTGYSSVATFTTSALIITPAILPNAIVNVDFNQSITPSGGAGPYVFTVSSGTLPPGLTLNPVGVITGAPTASGLYSFTLTVTDAGGATRSQTYSVFVTPAVTFSTTAVPDSALNAPGYNFTIVASGGTGDKNFQITSGSLPPGLNMDPTGLITGTPIITGLYSFTVTATDVSGATASQAFTLAVGMPVTISTTSLPAGDVNQRTYQQTVVAYGGTGFKSFAVTGGTLPPGLTLANNGVIAGVPTTTGNYTFTVTANDVAGVPAVRDLSIVINPALVITTTSLPASPVAVTYNQAVATTGGTGAAAFTLTSGTLPPGLTLGPDGTLTGSPTTAGTYTFTLTATDTVGGTVSQALSIVVGGPVVVSTATLTAPVINTSGYRATLAATGGTGSKTFAVTSGNLPTGLSLSSAGVISGTATAAGTYNFTITATDEAGATGTKDYTLVVAPPVTVAQTITFAALPNHLATDSSFSLAATSTSGLPVTYTVTGPAVLNGTTVTLTGQAGVVTITANQAGNGGFNPATAVVQSFTVTAADRLVNLSSRVRIAPDANHSLIAGFVIGGVQPKRVLLRATGPALTGFGVTGAVTNPKLQVLDAGGRVVVENEDWTGTDTAAAAAQVGAFALPNGSRDAAVVMSLQPGAYTMMITAGTETGVALAEVYDAGANPGGEVQRLVNISTRGDVEPGEGVLIGGFVVSGTTPKRVLVRGVGPGLAAFGVGSTLADPRVAIYSGTTIIAQNDDWSVPTPVTPGQSVASAADLTAVAQSVGAFALTPGSKDAAVLVVLAPGAYTAQVAGAGTTSGVALVEVYEAP